MSAWHPIETAPTGTRALFCSMRSTIDASQWCFVDWRSNGQFMEHKGWTATHWMPLPAPPSWTARDGGRRATDGRASA